MTLYVLRRILGTVPVLLTATTVAFLVLRLLPGDPVTQMLLGRPVSDTVRENVRKKLGLDRPIVEQYLQFVLHSVQGDFGESFRTGQQVRKEIADQLPATLELAAGGMLIGAAVGMSLGIVAGLRPNSLSDAVASLVALVGISIPSYWSAMLLIYIFGIKLGWVPIVGRGLKALILPSLVVGTFAVGDIARLTRSSILEIMKEDYVRTARAKGLSSRSVILQHALRNALIPVVTVMGLQLGLLFTGAVITETVFARQGIGALLVEAILVKDYPLVQALIILTTMGYVLANLVVDLSYIILDPRIRYA